MGSGNDTITGFGTINLIGGSGTDSVVVGNSGTWIVTTSSKGYSVQQNSITMNLSGIEQIGSESSLVKLQAGTLVITNGTAAWQHQLHRQIAPPQ